MQLSRVPIVRKPTFDAASTARYWLGGRVRTHLANGLNFVFPEGERFFIRSVRAYQDRITDPVLQERIAAFVGQEAQHQRAHLAAFSVLQAQGLELASWMTWYERTAYQQLEPQVPKIVRLATTAALEHFTATFGELALRTELLDSASPPMRALLQWHAAEEIEHRDVAYDVLQQVDARWIVRAAGFVVAVLTLAFFWQSATRHLLRQDPPSPQDREDRGHVRAFWRREGPAFARAILAYLRPGFHPREGGGDALAVAFLQGFSPAM